MPNSSPFKRRPWAEHLADPPAEKETESVAAALQRIGQTVDGKTVAKFLRRYYLEAVPPVGTPVGALREIEAARRIAAHLLISMERKANERNQNGGSGQN